MSSHSFPSIQMKLTSVVAGIYVVPAELAFDCLETVPFKKHDALRVIDGLAAFWQWQSTIDYLKDPPMGYMMPATDLRARIKKIRNKIAKEEYPHEYAFQDEMHELAVSVHDSHFNLQMDLLDIFVFRRKEIGPIVSVSKDGVELPEIYVLSEYLLIRPVVGTRRFMLTHFSLRRPEQDRHERLEAFPD